MKLLILSPPTNTEAPAYRGTERTTPYYREELGEEHEVNQAFFWYCSEGDQEEIVHDLEKARELIRAYRRLDPPQHFEVVAISTSAEPPDKGIQSEFLGFDLSAGYRYSLLSWGLEIDRKPLDSMPENDLFRILQPLLRLVKIFFQEQLNSNGLFSDIHTANFCLECMITLQKIRPGIWENEDVEFEVVGLWQLRMK